MIRFVLLLLALVQPSFVHADDCARLPSDRHVLVHAVPDHLLGPRWSLYRAKTDSTWPVRELPSLTVPPGPAPDVLLGAFAASGLPLEFDPAIASLSFPDPVDLPALLSDLPPILSASVSGGPLHFLFRPDPPRAFATNHVPYRIDVDTPESAALALGLIRSAGAIATRVFIPVDGIVSVVFSGSTSALSRLRLSLDALSSSIGPRHLAAVLVTAHPAADISFETLSSGASELLFPFSGVRIARYNFTNSPILEPFLDSAPIRRLLSIPRNSEASFAAVPCGMPFSDLDVWRLSYPDAPIGQLDFTLSPPGEAAPIVLRAAPSDRLVVEHQGTQTLLVLEFRWRTALSSRSGDSS